MLGVLLFLITVIIYEVIINNEVRQTNTINLNNAENCAELHTIYDKIMEYENGFSDNMFKDKMDYMFYTKNNDLDCSNVGGK